MSRNLEVPKEPEGTLSEINIDTQSEGSKARRRQYFIAFCAHLGALNMAMVWSWSSTGLPSLRLSAGTIGVLSKTDEAWIASIIFLAGAVGSTVTGLVMQKVGLRKSLIISCVPLICGWMFIVLAHSVWIILLGRFISGFCVSGVGASVSLMGELAHGSRRGKVNLGFHFEFCVGVLAMYIIGNFVEWKAQAFAGAAAAALYLVLLICIVVESPGFLLYQKNEAQAIENLKHVRDSENIGVEFNGIKRTVDTMLQIKETANEGGNFKRLVEKYASKEVMKPIFIAIGLQFFLQACGALPILCYAVDVFKAAGTEGVHENVSTIVLGVFNLFATGVAIAFVEKQGRRRMLILSEIILFLALVVLGVFLMFKNQLGNNPIWNWIPLLCLVIFIIGYSFGIGPLPWVLMGEIFSPSAKGFSQGIVIFTARIFGFLVMFFFKDMNALIGQEGVYLLFATVCFCGAVFACFFVPETNGKSEVEIQSEIKEFWLHHKSRSGGSLQSIGIALSTISPVVVVDPPVSRKELVTRSMSYMSYL